VVAKHAATATTLKSSEWLRKKFWQLLILHLTIKSAQQRRSQLRPNQYSLVLACLTQLGVRILDALIMITILQCARFFSSGCGSGFARHAPGTVGSVAALVMWWFLSSFGLAGSPAANLSLLVITTIVGTIAVATCLRAEPNSADPQWIVIDEWAGLFVALLALTPDNWGLVLLALGLFRVLDASKIGPVGWAEQLPGAWGIMADDLVAGALVALIILAIKSWGIV
jgi:phosphatidylglycerophosphatase A